MSSELGERMRRGLNTEELVRRIWKHMHTSAHVYFHVS